VEKYIKLIPRIALLIIVASLCFALLVFSILMITMAIKSLFGLSDELANAVANLIGSIIVGIIAGAFTLTGVDQTFTKQVELQFINDFPSKIKKLDEILEKLNQFNERISKDNIRSLHSDENFISSLFDLGTQVDGATYFRLRQTHLAVQPIINEMFRGENKLFSHDRYGQWRLIEGKEKDVEKYLTELKQHTQELINYVENLRATFIQHYNEKIKNSSIYKSV
jgi:phosphotransferase system  glucose/maltose/N-acetylglucosamine-specific IIC component